MDRLDGKIAVVTGGGGCLGQAIGVSFAREGARVVVQDVDRAAARSTQIAIKATTQHPGEVWVCDVTDSAAIDAMFDFVTTSLGVANVLVNCAGVDHTPGDGAGTHDNGAHPQIVAMTNQGWQRMLDVHLNGAFYCSRAFIGRLLDRNEPGSIISISSVAALAGGPIHCATAKAGLLGLTRAMALLSGPDRIRANAICPGVIDTPMTKALNPDAIERLREMTPLGRIGQPDDVAHAAVYLASDESSFVTSQYISPNGGRIMA